VYSEGYKAKYNVFNYNFSTINLMFKCTNLLKLFAVHLTIFNEGAYLTFKSIFHKAFNLLKFDCEFKLKSVPGTNQY